MHRERERERENPLVALRVSLGKLAENDVDCSTSYDVQLKDIGDEVKRYTVEIR